MRPVARSLAPALAVAPLLLATLVQPADAAGRPGQLPDADDAVLSGWAVLAADTFVPASEPSGYFRTPQVVFPGQPVQGFSGVHALADGSLLTMSDNGFGTKTNSQDYVLRVHRIVPDTASGELDVVGGFHLSDPDRLVPWPIWRDGGCAAEAALPAGYTCPAAERLLTGWDFDIESMQVAPDGTLWFGEEFGPFLLHTDAGGRLLQPPVPTPGVQAPQNPTLAPGEQPNLGGSKGFEGMAISPNGTTLRAMLEGPVAEDVAAGRTSDLRVYDVRVRRNGAVFTGDFARYRLEDPSHAIGDFVAVNAVQFLVIERDNASGAAAAFKRVYLVDRRDRDGDGYLDKHLLVDLMDLANPDGLGLTGEDPFTFPYVTIEDVELVDADTIVVLNDNNYPGGGGRGPQSDVTEYLEIDLGGPLAVDARLLPRG